MPTPLRTAASAGRLTAGGARPGNRHSHTGLTRERIAARAGYPLGGYFSVTPPHGRRDWRVVRPVRHEGQGTFDVVLGSRLVVARLLGQVGDDEEIGVDASSVEIIDHVHVEAGCPIK